MSLQICAPVSVIRNEKPNNSNNTCPYKTAKVRHLPQQIQSLSAQPPLPNVKHALGRMAEAAWEAYAHSRKSPHTRKAGPEFAHPDYDLALDWIAAHEAVTAAQRRFENRSGANRFLLI